MTEESVERAAQVVTTCEHCYHREKRPDCEHKGWYDKNDQDKCCKCGHAKRLGT